MAIAKRKRITDLTTKSQLIDMRLTKKTLIERYANTLKGKHKLATEFKELQALYSETKSSLEIALQILDEADVTSPEPTEYMTIGEYRSKNVIAYDYMVNRDIGAIISTYCRKKDIEIIDRRLVNKSVNAYPVTVLDMFLMR